MNTETVKKVFPNYFKYFEMPTAAREQAILVYRACCTRKLDRGSFLSTYEENGFKNSVGADPEDPQEYCMSTSLTANAVRRFVVVDSKYQPPYILARGYTSPDCGLSCKTIDWKPKTKSKFHVDYWLYENAEPWKDFEAVNYEECVSKKE